VKIIRNLLNKTSVKFGASASILNIVLMLSNVLVIYWIAPNLMGLWNSFMIFISYVYILQLGIINGLARDLPFFIGAGKTNLAYKITATSLFVVKFCSLISVVVSIIITVYFYCYYDLVYFYTSVVFCLLSTTQFYNNYLLSTFRSNEAFDKLSTVFFIQTAIVVFTIILVPFWGYEGNLIRLAIITFSQLILLYFYRPIIVTSKWNFKIFKHLLITGSKLFTFNYVYLLIPTFIRLIILQLGTTFQIGLYSPAIAVNSLMMLLPNTLSQYFYPKMSSQLGKTNSSVAVMDYSFSVMKKLFVILVGITIIGLVSLPFFINYFLPAYIKGIFPAQLALISGLISGIGLSLYTALLAIKAFKLISVLIITKSIIFYSFIYFFGTIFELLTGVSIGLLISEFLFFIILFFSCYAIKKRLSDVK